MLKFVLLFSVLLLIKLSAQDPCKDPQNPERDLPSSVCSVFPMERYDYYPGGGICPGDRECFIYTHHVCADSEDSGPMRDKTICIAKTENCRGLQKTSRGYCDSDQDCCVQQKNCYALGLGTLPQRCAYKGECNTQSGLAGDNCPSGMICCVY